MNIDSIGFLGWIHLVGCLVALVTGAWNLVAFDRGKEHRLRGHIYSASMITANLLVFAICDFDIDFAPFRSGANIFGFFHWLAVSSLAFTTLGWFASVRQRHGVWAYVHPIAMLLSYYILVGGLVNETFTRVDGLHAMASVTIDGQRRFGSRVVGLTQFAVMVATLILIALYTVRVGLRRRKRKNSEASRSAAPLT